MAQFIRIMGKKYKKLKKETKATDSAVVQLKLSLLDLKEGRVSKF
jgi:hypothetical protein